jgi:hypothetical protein
MKTGLIIQGILFIYRNGELQRRAKSVPRKWEVVFLCVCVVLGLELRA